MILSNLCDYILFCTTQTQHCAFYWVQLKTIFDFQEVFQSKLSSLFGYKKYQDSIHFGTVPVGPKCIITIILTPSSLLMAIRKRLGREFIVKNALKPISVHDYAHTKIFKFANIRDHRFLSIYNLLVQNRIVMTLSFILQYQRKTFSEIN